MPSTCNPADRQREGRDQVFAGSVKGQKGGSDRQREWRDQVFAGSMKGQKGGLFERKRGVQTVCHLDCRAAGMQRRPVSRLSVREHVPEQEGRACAHAIELNGWKPLDAAALMQAKCE